MKKARGSINEIAELNEGVVVLKTDLKNIEKQKTKQGANARKEIVATIESNIESKEEEIKSKEKERDRLIEKINENIEKINEDLNNRTELLGKKIKLINEYDSKGSLFKTNDELNQDKSELKFIKNIISHELSGDKISLQDVERNERENKRRKELEEIKAKN